MGDAFDAIAAFFGAAVAGVTLFLPVTFSAIRDSTPYRITNLVNSVPRGAAIGVIVAVAVAVIVCTAARPATAWLTALLGALAQLINHIAGEQVSSADMLTTQNYIDAVCAGIVLGGLGAAVLRRPLPAVGLALGAAGFFVFSDLSALLHIDLDPFAVLETPPRWLIVLALVLLVFSTMRNWSATDEQPQRASVELPITPILAALVLALVILAVTEWLTKQFSNAPGSNHAVDIGLAAAATIAAATVAAMLLPGRDGAAVYLAVALTAAADAFGYAPRPAWTVWGMVALTAIGILAGVRMPSMTLAVTLIAGIAGFAVLTPPDANRLLFAASSAVLALTAGYCCATARPRYAPSGVLALSALYLPSVVTALPDTEKAWHDPGTADYNSTPGRAALTIALGSAVGLAVLYRLRPRGRPRASGSTPDAALADI
ncbi:hypothetical protein F5X71_33635 [Nocardia brasiliensis]|uniref:Uncharacterized protein n=1 Tax=Nocardia brasiliensis TaxID=37326 RepID=A0A6G9Y066_NOCBR|nr:hypothetical protein [Nocardia brasiliensis]QIS06589.1 hypothetical protein F5X71_33635 [Nocardia brasiliensis]